MGFFLSPFFFHTTLTCPPCLNEFPQVEDVLTLGARGKKIINGLAFSGGLLWRQRSSNECVDFSAALTASASTSPYKQGLTPP